MGRARSAIVVAVILMLAVVGGGCGQDTAPEPEELTPVVAPPVIAEEGTLRVGVDLEYPPFGGTDGGVEAGIDVDLGAAIAERLGLRVVFVDVAQSEIATALGEGTVDIMLGATPITGDTLANVSTAGSYLIDAPAIYAVVPSGTPEATMTPEGLVGMRVATQMSSESYWILRDAYGVDFATAFDTLREAFEALSAGEADVVVGDAAVCSYMARDFQDVHFVGQMAPGRPLGIAVRKDAVELEEHVRSTLGDLVSEGVVDAIKRKWLGEFPPLESASE